MIKMLKCGAALASCVVLSFWSIPLASGSEAQASGSFAPGNPSVSSMPASATPPAFSLTVSPTRLVVGQADIGVSQKIQVTNNGKSSESVNVEKRNFTGGSDGSLVFQDSAPYSASEWVTIDPATFDVAPGATQIVTASITVPSAPEPGDHQVALVFLVPAGQTSANIKINRGIGTPVYITVAGVTNDSTSLSDLSAKGFATGGPVKITAKIHDTGTVHRDFRGATPLKISASGTAAAFPDFTVMRGATREISTTWDPPLMCICHPSVSVVNADGTRHSMTVRIIVLPLPGLGIIAGAALMLAIGGWLARRQFRASVTKAAVRLNRPVSVGDA
ncbi:MAG: hypothetical protein QOK20_1788 [Acidimicrobiaceae bacterium]|nr:hypothetical protein [Acidimicrobiaceae bacterium]